MRERPSGRVAMKQTWSQLAFLHWEVPVAEVAKILPEGLEVDTFEGKTYVGLVPFTMTGVRPAWCCSVPGLSDFHETNVRVYVIGPDGTPGVWFCSLEAANRVAVSVARGWFGLPYFFAEMTIEDRAGLVCYESTRMGTGETCEVEVLERGATGLAEPGTLDFWLIERYVLYAMKRGDLWMGRVWHTPYEVARARCGICRDELVAAAGIEVSGTPDLVHWSPGVEVDVFAPRMLGR